MLYFIIWFLHCSNIVRYARMIYRWNVSSLKKQIFFPCQLALLNVKIAFPEVWSTLLLPNNCARHLLCVPHYATVRARLLQACFHLLTYMSVSEQHLPPSQEIGVQHHSTVTHEYTRLSVLDLVVARKYKNFVFVLILDELINCLIWCCWISFSSFSFPCVMHAGSLTWLTVTHE